MNANKREFEKQQEGAEPKQINHEAHEGATRGKNKEEQSSAWEGLYQSRNFESLPWPFLVARVSLVDFEFLLWFPCLFASIRVDSGRPGGCRGSARSVYGNGRCAQAGCPAGDFAGRAQRDQRHEGGCDRRRRKRASAGRILVDAGAREGAQP